MFYWNTRGIIWSERNFSAKIATLPVGQLVLEYETGDCPICGKLIPTYQLDELTN